MLCGDFRQILPMTKFDTRANIMKAYIKKTNISLERSKAPKTDFK